jgi:hypothetical protein
MSVKQIEIDKGWNKILKQHKINSIEIETGLWGSGDNPKNNLAYLGSIHQYGATIKVTEKMKGYFAANFLIRKSNRPIIIPKRPFVSNAMDKNESKIKNFIKNEYTKVVDGKQTFKKAMDRIGVMHEGQMKKSIVEFTYTPNSSMTATIKGSSKPLIDTGTMKNFIKYKVKYK